MIASQGMGCWGMQQKQELLIFWITNRMKTGDVSEVDGHGERAGAEVSAGRARLAPGDGEGMKAQNFWGPLLGTLLRDIEPELFLCYCTINK